MTSKFSDIEVLVRQKLIEPTPKFWSSSELVSMAVAGAKDLWRDVVNLKQEHYLKVDKGEDGPGVTFTAGSDRLTGLPEDIHKVYLIEARHVGSNETNNGLIFQPKDYNHRDFQLARSRDAITPTNDTIYYSITGQGGPVNAPIIYCAPGVTSTVSINFSYVPTLGDLKADDIVPIPGEADNAIVAWTVAYARAKERDDRMPDPGWLAIYNTEKQHLLESLGLREYQEPSYAEAVFREYWGVLLAAGLAALPILV